MYQDKDWYKYCTGQPKYQDKYWDKSKDDLDQEVNKKFTKRLIEQVVNSIPPTSVINNSRKCSCN